MDLEEKEAEIEIYADFLVRDRDPLTQEQRGEFDELLNQLRKPKIVKYEIVRGDKKIPILTTIDKEGVPYPESLNEALLDKYFKMEQDNKREIMKKENIIQHLEFELAMERQ
jgi:hypothetical protein